MDLEAQIAALEAEESTSSSSESDEEGSGSETGDSKNVKPSGVVETVDDQGNVVIIKSSLGGEYSISDLYLRFDNFMNVVSSDEAPIAPLTAKYLPAPNCGVTTKKDQSKKKQKKTFFPSSENEKSGLEKTVAELLKNYQPSSSERRPFWCRICRFQGTSELDLMDHRKSEFHVVASKKERKLSFCKLCKIQFTSPDQLKEHLNGAKHKAKLDGVIQNQQRSKNSSRKSFVRI